MSLRKARSESAGPATLVLVHGCGTDRHFWDELLPHLDGVAAVAPSLPGRGDTGGEPLPSARANAEWLLGWIERSAIERAIVVGHSFGGAVAIETALAGRPEVCGLGLVATGARLRVLPQILEMVSVAAETGVAARLDRFAYHPSTDPALMERIESRRPPPPATTRQDWLSTDAFDRLGQLAPISVPTAIVCGTEDGLTPPKYARYLADHIRGAELVFVEGAGHMFPVTRPAALAAALRALVAAVGH